MLCWLSSPVAEVDCFVRVSGLDGLACWFLLSFSCHLALRVGWPGLLASESLRWLRCIPLQLVLVAVNVRGTNFEVSLELLENVCCCGCCG